MVTDREFLQRLGETGLLYNIHAYPRERADKEILYKLLKDGLDDSILITTDVNDVVKILDRISGIMLRFHLHPHHWYFDDCYLSRDKMYDDFKMWMGEVNQEYLKNRARWYCPVYNMKENTFVRKANAYFEILKKI